MKLGHHPASNESYNTGLMQNGIRELHRISDVRHVTGVFFFENMSGHVFH
jgi:hypothetical protein